MYHPMVPPPMIMQIVRSQQTNGQCTSPAQTHALHTNHNTNTATRQTEYTQYVSDEPGNNRRFYMQLMSVDIPAFRRSGYNMENNSGPLDNWQRRSGSSNNTSMPPPSYMNYRNNPTASLKKQNWHNNKSSKRNNYRDPLPQKEIYSSDSGFGSRSPTPNKHPVEGSQNESSDDRDSVSSNDQTKKRLQELPQNTAFVNSNASQSGMSSGTAAQQFYESQRHFYQSNNSNAPRTQQLPNYQGKKRYHNGRNTSPTQRIQKGRKFTGLVLPTYSMLPRSCTAPDRFLARSHLIQVNTTPNELYSRTVWNDLSREIWIKFMANQQTEDTYRNKMLLWKVLFVYIKTTFPKYGIFLVGSTMNGFGSDNSDVDLCLVVRQPDVIFRIEAMNHLQQIQKCLRGCDFVEHIELIKAKVPILKFRDYTRNLEVDLNCNNVVGIRNTHLLYCYSRIDWRVRPLVLVVKLWAQCQDINDAKNMTISSYSLVLMVIHFLQCGINPSVLPCLHSIYPSKFNSTSDIHMIDIQEDLRIDVRPLNRQPLGELLFEFFKYYAFFDYSKYAVSVRLARKVPIEECRRVQSYKNDPYEWKYLCIEEPFEQTNTARSVYDCAVFTRIKQVIMISYQRLKDNRDLGSIFTKIPSRI